MLQMLGRSLYLEPSSVKYSRLHIFFWKGGGFTQYTLKFLKMKLFLDLE